MERKHNKVSLILKGAAMGVAEVVPGVSGGTIAFITGIYQELIDTIKAVGPEAYDGWKSGGISGLWQAVNGNFLLWLLVGMGGGLVSGVFGVTYLLEYFPEPLWAFFFGLILASALYMATQVRKWEVSTILSLVIGAVTAYLLTTLSPAEGSTSYLYVYVSGAIAISALMLPGISGSFILLIMGMYTVIIPMLKDVLKLEDLSGLSVVAVFAVGCLTGLVVFSRVLSWLFKTYEQVTMALLTGFLVGALNKVWPWRNISAVLDKDKGTIVQIESIGALGQYDPDNIKILTESNVMPPQYWGDQSYVLASVAAFFLGIVLVYALSRVDSQKIVPD